MTAHSQTFTSDLPASPEAALAWHARDGAFERLTPPWTKVRVVSARGHIAPGDGKVLQLGIGPGTITWEIEHEALPEGLGFADVQRRGPFASWRHEHLFQDNEPARPGTTTLQDRITWSLPMGSAGTAVAGRRVSHELDRVFLFRHQRLRHDLRFHTSYPSPPLRIAITGATGLVGRQLTHFLRAGGHTVLPIVRKATGEAGEIQWDPARQTIQAELLEGIDAVIHLAGASIAGGLWTASRKRAIRESRVQGTALLARTLAGLRQPPKVLVSTSAVGYYGSAPGMVLTEASPAGDDFLSDVCRDWEAAAAPAATAGIRVVHPRFGVVFSGYGGMLPLLARLFLLGGGGRLGNGRQAMSWIALDDLLGILLACITTDTVQGPVNATSPGIVSNAEFTRTLASVLRRPALFNAPAFMLRAVAGDLANELLLADQHVVPERLQEAEFAFQLPSLEQALRFELGRASWSSLPVVTR